MDEKIAEAVKGLDVTDDSLWTDDKPKVDVVRELVGDPTVARGDINRATNGYKRNVMTDESDKPDTQDAKEEADHSVDLAVQLSDLDTEIAEVSNQRIAIENKLTDLKAQRDAVILAIRASENKEHDQTVVSNYLKSQLAANEARAQAHHDLVKNGITPELLKAISPISPLDLAYRSK